MKTTFQLKATGKDCKIYIRLRHATHDNLDIIKPSEFDIDSVKWDKINQKAKGRSEDAKALNHQLTELKDYVRRQFNTDYPNGKHISKEWLERTIEKFHGQERTKDENALISGFEKYIEELELKEGRNNNSTTSFRTIQKYKAIANHLRDYEVSEKKTFHYRDISREWRNGLIKHLRKKNLSENTIGRYLKFIKTVFRTAVEDGRAEQSQLKHLTGYSVKAEKIILTFEEIQILRETRFLDLTLEAVKDWLIIGCYTGQRISDLLNMTSENFVSYAGVKLIELTQQKTGKVVQIPIHPIVNEILKKRENNFPPAQGKTLGARSAIFNRKAKLVCKNAGLDGMVKGSLKNPETKKLEVGEFEKWKLITSHICRRSFASNFYGNEKYPTPLLMNITGHATEKQFLEYIGKPPSDFSLQLADKWKNEEVKPVRNIKNIG